MEKTMKKMIGAKMTSKQYSYSATMTANLPMQAVHGMVTAESEEAAVIAASLKVLENLRMVVKGIDSNSDITNYVKDLQITPCTP